MTLRAKTRSRKGKDLKRLDGMKHRLTRRRLRQRGGAEPVTSFAAWLSAVNKENSLFKDSIDTESEDYDIERIKTDSDKHKLPLFNGEQLEQFKMPNGMDVRGAAAIVVALLKLIMDRKPNVGQFRDEMIAQQQPAADVIAAADVQSQLNILADIEHSIRREVASGNSSAGELTKEISDPFSILTNNKEYPLYIWALYYSAPEGDISIPILTSPEKVASETGSSEVPTPASQADTMP
jgi:hypothetical protein